MPEISRFYGIIVFMFYEDHNPPHIHVKYQEYKAIIELKNGIIKGKMPRIALKLIFQWIDLHRDEIIDNWEL
ncbi:MAG TPA: DUF4160 domain-containing protein, partial [Bacteroidetes bacterium]|nr:DUF4160 domain-containing protein [Bacteroidota bacterium]